MGDKSAGGSFGGLQPEHCDQCIGKCGDLDWFWYRGQPIGPTGHDRQGVGGSGKRLSTPVPHITCRLLLVAGPYTPKSGGDDSYRAGNVRGNWRTVANDILDTIHRGNGSRC